MINWIQQNLRQQLGPLLFLFFSLLFSAVVAIYLIWPAYKNPKARMFTSKLGYATVLRKTGQPFPVQTSFAEQRVMTSNFLGEGLLQSEPIQVPMIGMARILKIHAKEGDRVEKGALLVELDDERIKLQVEAAAAALETARAESERVRVGSVNILMDERPELNRIQLESAKKQADSYREILAKYQNLFERGSVSRKVWLEQQVKAKEADVQYRKLLMSTGFAAEGKKNSLRIAEATIREAEMAWLHRKSQLKDYQSYAPASGIVERILAHEGEYNQDPGRPAMTIAAGLWFEASFDQTTLGQIAVGNEVEVRLSAFQDRIFRGAITRIKPVVGYSTGGPETTRPIRPSGTGAPEWPATFSAIIQLDDSNVPLVPGLTGFARVINRRTNVCVPRGAISATSGNRAIVFVVDEEGDQCQPRDVAIGWSREGWTEILEGIDIGEQVVVEGYQVLEPGDSIVCEVLHKKVDQQAVGVALARE